MGFADWNKRDFQQFINGSAKYGRKSYAAIAEEVDHKNEQQIKLYAKVFWSRYTEVADYSKYISLIEAGEEKLRKVDHQRKMLRKKIAQYRVPLQQLKVNYSVSTTNKKVYTEEEDRFLLVTLDKYGVDSEGIHERIRDDIRNSPLFRFDWFFLSRTPVEISRRCTTLLTTVAREFEEVTSNKTSHAAANGKLKREAEDDANNQDCKHSSGPAKKKVKNSVKKKAIENSKIIEENLNSNGTGSQAANGVSNTKGRTRGRKK